LNVIAGGRRVEQWVTGYEHARCTPFDREERTLVRHGAELLNL
jgi:hypothetical protein